jgi:hypothetical protein
MMMMIFTCSVLGHVLVGVGSLGCGAAAHAVYSLEHLRRHPPKGGAINVPLICKGPPSEETSETCTLDRATELTDEELTEEVL